MFVLGRRMWEDGWDEEAMGWCGRMRWMRWMRWAARDYASCETDFMSALTCVDEEQHSKTKSTQS